MRRLLKICLMVILGLTACGASQAPEPKLTETASKQERKVKDEKPICTLQIIDHEIDLSFNSGKRTLTREGVVLVSEFAENLKADSLEVRIYLSKTEYEKCEYCQTPLVKLRSKSVVEAFQHFMKPTIPILDKIVVGPTDKEYKVTIHSKQICGLQ